MCGICGIVGDGPREEARGRVQAMCDVLSHRGPDDEGFHVEEHVALGMRRLAIIDVAGGRQPIANEDETVWVVFNGEIYNHRELRAELESQGHRFRTESDTEVIVHAYEEYGTDCACHLAGMFAFGLWDRRRRRFYAARDRMGQKPFYYNWDGERLAFGSELKALMQLPDISREVDDFALHHYLTLPICARAVEHLPLGAQAAGSPLAERRGG